ncbi:MAG: class I SAM-dependent methyltransferase [Anaerolineaceae bacterium]|nr:MAG: class I SAM-dependent methyltransferase [Anaerolineaceae bacterium]
MDAEPTQWEKIFQQDGHVFPEPRLQVMQFAEGLLQRGLTSVLDLGCGNGRHTVHMAQKGLCVFGMDNAPTALRLTREWLGRERLAAGLVLSDMRRALPFASDAFDAVLSTQVIHHAVLATVLGTAREIERVVRKGGIIMISVPLRKAIEEDSNEHEEIEPDTFVPTSGTEKGLPHHLFTPDELSSIFPQFRVTDLQVSGERVMVLQAIKK